MKPNLTVFTAICIVMIMLTPGTSADGPPPIPASFTGTVTVNGEPAQDGTVVSAFIDGAEIANAETVNGEYGIGVPGSASATITFKIYDTVAATATWSSGEFMELDLSAEGVVTSKSSGGSGDSAAPSTTSTPTPTVAITEGDISPEQPTSAPLPEGSGASAESPEVAPVDQGGEKPLSSIPGFAGVTAVFMLLMLSWLRRSSERK
jgi:hypothetical protein